MYYKKSDCQITSTIRMFECKINYLSSFRHNSPFFKNLSLDLAYLRNILGVFIYSATKKKTHSFKPSLERLARKYNQDQNIFKKTTCRSSKLWFSALKNPYPCILKLTEVYSQNNFKVFYFKTDIFSSKNNCFYVFALSCSVCNRTTWT